MTVESEKWEEERMWNSSAGAQESFGGTLQSEGVLQASMNHELVGLRASEGPTKARRKWGAVES